MNLIEEFKKGQAGGNKGLPMGEGVINISKAINGIQKGRMYGVAGGPKSGKSTFTDYAFVIQPYLYAVEHNIPVEWIYYSFELDRVSKEFDFATYFLYSDFGIETITLEEGVTYTMNGKSQSFVPLSPDYLRGRLQDDNGNVITIKDSVKEALISVYEKRIIPMFGEYDIEGGLLREGVIQFIENKENPTGIYKHLLNHAKKEGKFAYNSSTAGRITGYTPNDTRKYTIIIIDHIRKLITERGFLMKQTVDKMLEYMIEVRNWCGYTFVPIIHTNRGVTDVDRIRHAGDELYASSDDLKDSGNMSEDCDYLFTMFNPNDERYRLQKHFGLQIKDSKGNPIFPLMRTIHLVESRHCIFPQHFRSNMIGNLKTFSQITINK